MSDVEHCQTTPEGSLFPGRPGETLDAYLVRANAEFAGFMAAHPDWISPASNRPEDRFGHMEYGR